MTDLETCFGPDSHTAGPSLIDQRFADFYAAEEQRRDALKASVADLAGGSAMEGATAQQVPAQPVTGPEDFTDWGRTGVNGTEAVLSRP